jgi:hypothetical protein
VIAIIIAAALVVGIVAWLWPIVSAYLVTHPLPALDEDEE